MSSPSLTRRALFLTLVALQWRPALLHAIPCQDVLDTLKSVTALLGFETKLLLQEYKLFHGLTKVTPSKVPDASVVGADFPEQLQDIFAKSVQYSRRMEYVEQYQTQDWGNPESVGQVLRRVKFGLYSQTNLLRVLARQVQPEVLLATEEPPPPSDNHGYAKKMYGLRAIVGLRDWLTRVLQTLQEARQVCHDQTLTTRTY
ncbi:uncharacterized protein LOC133563318 [Nerophis ophidion]|uniref:uncharacterized protein LOC133563318 n=1 Tax=Nerophis ophidion TaxID=159077 RepID=UPI002ADFB1AC|nr:uncharacterized protein LOC133563318 [Nerophis ophidion]